MNKIKELVKNTALISLGKISTQLINFLLLPLYTSKIPSDEYGSYDFVVTVSAFAVPVITMLMEEAMFRFLIDSKGEEDKKKLISQTFVFCLLSTGLASIFFAVFSFFHKSEFDVPIWIYSIALISFTLSNALSRGEGRIALYSFSNFAASISTIALTLFFIFGFQWGFKALILAGVISNVLASLFVFVKMKVWKYVGIRNCDIHLMRKMLKYSLPLVPHSICWTIIGVSDRFVIMYFLGAASNGLYSISNKFPNIINSFFCYFNIAWRESSAKMAKTNDYKDLNKIFQTTTSFLFSATICLITGIRLVYPFFVNESYFRSIEYVPILAVSVYYFCVAGFYEGVFTAFKDTKIIGITSSAAAAINLTVDVLLIRFWGIYAAALSTLASSIFVYYYRKIRTRRYVKIIDKINPLSLILFSLCMAVFYIDNRIMTWTAFSLAIIFSIVLNRQIINKVISLTLKRVFNKE